MKMREGVLMFKLLLIAVAILAGASLSARAEDQKTTNGLQQERPAEPTSTGLQQQSKKPDHNKLSWPGEREADNEQPSKTSHRRSFEVRGQTAFRAFGR
jgi:hypothetical protein